MKQLPSGPNIKVSVLENKILLARSQKGFFIEGDVPKWLMAWFEAYSEKAPLVIPKISISHLPLFTQKVLHSLMEIPFGTVTTYSELASHLGSPKAARAVGSACGRNPFLLLIPCHRVLAKGHIGGFAIDKRIKEELLLFETGAI